MMCVCTGKCPGFEKMDIWDFINRARIELPVEFADDPSSALRRRRRPVPGGPP